MDTIEQIYADMNAEIMEATRQYDQAMTAAHQKANERMAKVEESHKDLLRQLANITLGTTQQQ